MEKAIDISDGQTYDRTTKLSVEVVEHILTHSYPRCVPSHLPRGTALPGLFKLFIFLSFIYIVAAFLELFDLFSSSGRVSITDLFPHSITPSHNQRIYLLVDNLVCAFLEPEDVDCQVNWIVPQGCRLNLPT